MLQRIYNWILSFANHPYAIWILGAVSFAESSFFPIPPDPLYIAMLLSRKNQTWTLPGFVPLHLLWVGGLDMLLAMVFMKP